MRFSDARRQAERFRRRHLRLDGLADELGRSLAKRDPRCNRSLRDLV